jgi:hypothetical protein
MGRVYYRFGHDIALRLTNGQAFALKNAELGAHLGPDAAPFCFLRGTFTIGTLRALIARGLLPPNPQLMAQTQPLRVRLDLKREVAATIAKDAATLLQFGRRMEQNNLTDDTARNLLLLDVWEIAEVAPLEGGTVGAEKDAETVDLPPLAPAQADAITELVTSMASEMWAAVEEIGEAATQPSEEPGLALLEAIALFFEEENWAWETVGESGNLLRTIYAGQNSTWMCYTRILPENQQVIFYSICPIAVPKSALSTMTEFLCRVNADLAVGNFEIDHDHHTARFRTGVDVTDVGLTPLLFRNMVFENLAVMDIYLPEILGVIAGRDIVLPAS